MKVTILGKEMNWLRIKNMYALFNMRQGRGSGYFARFQELAYLGVLKLWVPIDNSGIIILAISYIIFTYIVGYYDEHKFKVWQVELEKSHTQIDPFENEMMNLIKQNNKLIKRLAKHGNKSK